MASPTSVTNLKLYRARLLIDQLRQLNFKSDASHVNDEHNQLNQALYEAVITQLHHAYLNYLKELANQSNIVANIDSLDSLVKQLPVVTGEVLEIKQLINANSWLDDFLHEVQLTSQPEQIKTTGHASDSALIISSQSNKSTLTMGQTFYEHLITLISRQRENFLES